MVSLMLDIHITKLMAWAAVCIWAITVIWNIVRVIHDIRRARKNLDSFSDINSHVHKMEHDHLKFIASGTKGDSDEEEKSKD
jgi:hypothetical protein